ARDLAGYTLGEADLLRKAMGKKNPEEMAKQRERFVSGCQKNSINKNLAGEIFNQMETFARYGFNRSHSAAYAMISFQTAYLKAHYKVEFMAALMSHEMDDSDKVLKNLNECRKQKIEVLPPNVNESIAGFSAKGGKIRYGLEAVKGIGEKAVQSIIAAREKGEAFESLDDFVARVDAQAVNRRVLESLVKSGAFDFSGASRREMFEHIDDALRIAQALNKEKNTNQISLFSVADEKPLSTKRAGSKPEWPVNQKLAYEREALGFYISGHPLEKFVADLKRMGALTTSDLKSRSRNSEVRVGGVITALKLRNTKKGDRYASFILEDSFSTVETLVWPDVYRQATTILVADDPVLISGRLDIGEERCTLIANKIESLIALRDRNATQGLIQLSESDNFESNLDQLLSLLRKYGGNCPVKVKVRISDSEISLALKDRKQSPVCVAPSEHLCDEVEQLFGRPVLSFF
ncbi:MAG: DNA polymerase III subunit alpha, partial [Proteobacteria bacterium]